MDRNINTTPYRRLHEDSVNGSGNHSHPSVLKFPHDDQGIYSAVTGKVLSSSRHDYHAPYNVGPENRIPKIVQCNELHDAADRRSSPLLPNMLFRVPPPNDSRTDHVGTETRMEFRDPKDSAKEIKVDSHEVNKDSKHERDAYSEHNGNEKTDKDCYGVSNNSQFSWKDMKEQQHRVKQDPEVVPGVNADTWHMSRTCLHGPTDAAKGSLHVVHNRNITEAVGENKVDMKGDDKFKDKDRKRKEVKLCEKEVEHWDWGEWNKEVVKEERELSERWANEKKEKEKMNEKEKDHVKRELWSSATDNEVFLHDEKDVVLDIHGKSVVEQESPALEVKKKEPGTWKNNIDREARDKKNGRDADVESERPDKRIRYHEKESDEGGMLAEGGAEREREVFGCGVQQRKRMLRPRSSPQMGNSIRHRAGADDNEGSHGKGELSCVNYKIGESTQELVRLWKEEVLQADKACEGSQDGSTLEIRIPAEYVTATNRQMTRGRGFSGRRAMDRGHDGSAGRGSGSGHDDYDSSHTSPRRDESTPPPSPARYAEQEELHDEQDQILDGLPWCRIVGQRLMPEGVSRAITKIFEANIPDEGFSWKDVLREQRDDYFEEFRKRYRWKEEEEKTVKDRFLKMSGKLYAGLVHRWKVGRAKGKGKPGPLTEDTWKKFEAYWDKPEVVSMSATKRANRLTDIDGDGSGVAKHVGGSRSAIAHMEDLRKQKGSEPNAYETFLSMMMRKDGAFADERSRKIAAHVEARRAELEQAGEEADMTKIFLEINGMSKKQRVVGLGSAATSYISTGSTSSRASGSSVHDDDVREQIRAVFEVNAKLQEELAMERTARIEMQSTVSQLSQTVALLTESLRRHGLPPLSTQRSPLGSDHS